MIAYCGALIFRLETSCTPGSFIGSGTQTASVFVPAGGAGTVTS